MEPQTDRRKKTDSARTQALGNNRRECREALRAACEPGYYICLSGKRSIRTFQVFHGPRSGLSTLLITRGVLHQQQLTATQSVSSAQRAIPRRARILASPRPLLRRKRTEIGAGTAYTLDKVAPQSARYVFFSFLKLLVFLVRHTEASNFSKWASKGEHTEKMLTKLHAMLSTIPMRTLFFLWLPFWLETAFLPQPLNFLRASSLVPRLIRSMSSPSAGQSSATAASASRRHQAEVRSVLGRNSRMHQCSNQHLKQSSAEPGLMNTSSPCFRVREILRS